MIKWIRLFVEYGAYPVWLYKNDTDVLDNDLPEEWRSDQDLDGACMKVAEFFDTLFLENGKEFTPLGFPDGEHKAEFARLVMRAKALIFKKNGGKYFIKDDIDMERIFQTNRPC